MEAGKSDVIVWRAPSLGAAFSNPATVAANIPGYIYKRGTMPEITELGGTLYLLYSNGGNYFLSTSTNDGSSWGEPIVVPGQEGYRYILPNLTSNDQGVFASGYKYEVATNTVQAVVMDLTRNREFAVGTPFGIPDGTLDNWNPPRFCLGDYNQAVDAGGDALRVAYSRCHVVATPLFPGFTHADGDVHVASVGVVPKLTVPLTTTVFRPMSGTTETAWVNVFNSAIVTGTWSVNSTKVDNTCANISGPGSVSLDGRTTTTARFTVAFDAEPNSRTCNYRVIYQNPWQTVTNTISAPQIEPNRTFLPNVNK